MKFTDTELYVIKGLLTGAMMKYNELIKQGHYFTKAEREMFDLIKGILEKMEEKENVGI